MVNTIIVIPHYNRLDLLKVCLSRLFDQSDKDFRVVVTDNGSTDGSVKWLRNECPQVCVIEMRYNTGFARAVNEGIRNSESKYIIVLNNDVEVSPDFVAQLVSSLEKDPSAHWAAPRTLMGTSRDRIDNCGLFLSRLGLAQKRFWDRKNDEVEHRAGEVFGASGNAVAFRRTFFDDVGLFDERFFAYCEDIDLALRAHFLGKKCIYVPDAVCFHNESSTWGRNSPGTIYYYQRNMEIAYFGVPKASFRVRYLIPHILHSVYLLGIWTLRGKGMLVLGAKRDAWRILRGKEPKYDVQSLHT